MNDTDKKLLEVLYSLLNILNNLKDVKSADVARVQSLIGELEDLQKK